MITIVVLVFIGVQAVLVVLFVSSLWKLAGPGTSEVLDDEPVFEPEPSAPPLPSLSVESDGSLDKDGAWLNLPRERAQRPLLGGSH